jgi:hypothetical protein
VLAQLDVEPVTNPLAELERVVGQITAWKDVCAAIVNRLQDTDLRYASAQQLEQVRGEVLIWERALDRAVLALTALAKLHIKEEITRVQERTLDHLARAFSASLLLARLPKDQENVVRLDFSKRLKEFGSEAV